MYDFLLFYTKEDILKNVLKNQTVDLHSMETYYYSKTDAATLSTDQETVT